MTRIHHAVIIDATPHDPGPLLGIVLREVAQGVQNSLAIAGTLGERMLDSPDHGPLDRWEALATLASLDVAAARIVEPHLDALTILRDAHRATLGTDRVGGLRWGVFAAEGGAEPLVASPVNGSRYAISGVKRWCSLAGRLDAALVTATVAGDAERRLFAVRLDEGIEVDESEWVARGLREIPSGPVRFSAVDAVPVGGQGWYVRRPGFSWGGVGVAACWYGGAVGIARTVHASLAGSSTRDPHALAHLGAIDELLQSARRALAEAASLATLDIADARLTAKRVRATVARTCDEVIDRAHRALGPAPLALDAGHAKRVADLQLYVRQHHAERDQASLGSAVADGPLPW